MTEISAVDAHSGWKAGQLTIIDVRERDEHERTHVDGVLLIPMSEIEGRVDDLPPGRIVLMCRSGARSARVASYLEQLGGDQEFINLEGGILAWAEAGLAYEGSEPE